MGCRGCLILLVALFLIVAILVGGTFYLFTRPSTLVAGMPAIIPSREASAEFDRKTIEFLTDLGSSVAAGDPEMVTLVVTEKEATSKLAEFARSEQFGIDILNPQVHFQDGRVRISSDVGARGMVVNMAVQVQVVSLDGKPEIVIDKVDFGEFGVPESIRKQVFDSITSGTGSILLEDLPIQIGNISVADGQLVIQGLKLP